MLLPTPASAKLKLASSASLFGMTAVAFGVLGEAPGSGAWSQGGAQSEGMDTASAQSGIAEGNRLLAGALPQRVFWEHTQHVDQVSHPWPQGSTYSTPMSRSTQFPRSCITPSGTHIGKAFSGPFRNRVDAPMGRGRAVSPFEDGKWSFST